MFLSEYNITIFYSKKTICTAQNIYYFMQYRIIIE